MEGRTLSMGQKRASKMPNCQRFFFPKARCHKEETQLDAKKNIILDTAREYIEKHCDEKGTQKACNLSQKAKDDHAD